MGAFLNKPKTDKSTLTGTGKDFSYALSSMQGWRVEMEDAHCAKVDLDGEFKDWSFFAVFDGHAGARVSALCSDQLLGEIIKHPIFLKPMQTEAKTQILPSRDSEGKTQVLSSKDSSSQGKLEQTPEGEPVEEEFNVTPPPPDAAHFVEGIRQGFLVMDENLRIMPEFSNGSEKSGSTAVCAFISPKYIFLANCGDSRGILSTSDGKVVLKSIDHKPTLAREKKRIQEAGGSVMIQRVNGALAVSRALGDFEYKSSSDLDATKQLVSPEPEVFWYERSDKDELLILACDGVWDVMTNEDLVMFVRDRLKCSKSLDDVCNQVIDTCLYKGSRDNMSIIIVAFDAAPKFDQAAAEKDQQLNEKICAMVEELVKSEQGIDSMVALMNAMAEKNIPDLPPAGGLASKRKIMEDKFNELRPPPKPEDDPARTDSASDSEPEKAQTP